MPIKQLAEVVSVRLLQGALLRNDLVAMAAVGTEPDDLTSGPVTAIVCARGEAAAIVRRAALAAFAPEVALGRSPRWRKMQIHDYLVCRRRGRSFSGSAFGSRSRLAFDAHDAQNRSSHSISGR